MAVHLPYTPAPLTGRPFIDTMMGLEDQRLRRDQFGLDLRRFEEYDLPHLEAQTGLMGEKEAYQTALTHQLDVLAPFLEEEAILDLETRG